MDESEVEIRVVIRDDTAAGQSRVKVSARKGGEEAGKEWGAGFERGRDGRLRDSRGRFVSASDPGGAGEESGRRFGAGFLAKFRESFSKGDGGGGAPAQKLVGSFMGAFQLSAKTLATGFSYQFTSSVALALAQGAAKMVHGLAAIGALLPAIAATGALAFGTIKLAVAGVGDALTAGLAGDTKKYEESLKGLAPPARAFAREVVGLKGGLDSLRNTVQGNFFRPLVDQVKPLGEIYLRQSHLALGQVATGFGEAARKGALFMQTPKAFRAVWATLDNGRQALGNLSAGFVNLLAAVLPVLQVGSTFLPKLTSGFGDATARLAEMVNKAAETGRLADFIQGGIDKLRSLGDTASRVWNIAKNLWGIFKQLGGFGSVLSQLGVKQGGLLTQLEDLTDRAAKFFSTSAGGKAMAEAIRTIRELLNASMGTFARLLGIIAPFAPQIAEFATAVNELLFAIIDAAEPVVQFLLGKVLPVLTKIVEYIANNGPLVQAILISLFTLWAVHAGIAAAATIAATWPFIALGVAIAGLAYLVITHFDTIKRVISGVWNWVKDHWPLLVSILTGPFAPITAVIIAKWDTIKNVFRGARDWIARLAGGLWSPIFNSLVSAVNGIDGQIRRVLDLLHLLPGQGGGTVNTAGHGGAYASLGAGRPKSSGGGGGGYRVQAHGGIGGGLSLLAERGEEMMKMPFGGPHGTLMRVPHGSMVYPAGATARMGGAGPQVVNNHYWTIQGSIRSDRDLIELIDREFKSGGFGGLGL